ncbi:mitochondrial large ribosomal subunit [Pochonia chlamydosporia 170]|uniref:Mitochondrial large ribosomal subunit n=1 Tax=Pochonia chlamydosporia 170 TaxID=1380566 RepID=A0A179FLD6_METCM|nr:mitochondrial large ribosomal subunit [Pochonia chlamydosporia 170]OAQ65809.1 mitochondrial large ribosomal subunit [Pochonia chlamydosporia 170]
MSLRLASRRLALSGPSPVRPSPIPKSSSTAQIRTKWSVNIFKGWGKSGSKDSSAKAPTDATSELDDPKKRAAFLERNMHGSVSDNIFQDEIDAAKPSAESEAPQQQEQKTRENMAMVTDPDPRSRIRWQRRKVIQMVRSNGAISKEERIKASERQLLHRSHFMPTSVKKLVMLSRQIAGKPVDEAISQMQWSKKKMAAEVKYYLEEARDLAIAQRGMGLGKVNGEVLEKPRKILTKDGKWIEVTDPTRMYVAQSWVGRGPWRGKEIDYKGRGRMGIIQHPSTSFTVLLKEEKTRIREYEEREAKKAAKGPWVHLPNRRVHGQRPYYSW